MPVSQNTRLNSCNCYCKMSVVQGKGEPYLVYSFRPTWLWASRSKAWAVGGDGEAAENNVHHYVPLQPVSQSAAVFPQTRAAVWSCWSDLSLGCSGLETRSKCFTSFKVWAPLCETSLENKTSVKTHSWCCSYPNPNRGSMFRGMKPEWSELSPVIPSVTACLRGLTSTVRAPCPCRPPDWQEKQSLFSGMKLGPKQSGFLN